MNVLWFAVLAIAASLGDDYQRPLNRCPDSGKQVHVHIYGIRNAQGTVKAVLYGPDPNDFLVKGKKTDKEREPAREGTMTLCVAAPDVGQYAVVIYHDENNNHKFDRNWIGLPTEGFGVSNNPSLFLAAPSFGESKFEVKEDITHIAIEMKY
ncbi:MAG: DUF2141 domain-containing protein [Nitrospirales bacterium]|nr:DUF2141 domain-containing protein [Nitrospirales bacterium]